MKNTYRKLISKIVLLTLSSLLLNTPLYANTAYTEMRNITALELTADMAPGINLWNTLDAACGSPAGLESETCWGNPVTTLAMISDLKERGFKTLRLPVTWYNHMEGAPNYKIDETWMDRVEEIANYAFQNDMYVIINIHHDDYDIDKPGSWLSPTYAKQIASTNQLEKIWSQIATRFKEYGDHLIFETMNEPRAIGTPQEWTGGSTEHREMVNAFNLAAVNTIRATNGNNSSRFIMTPQVGANMNPAINDLIIPNNDERIIVSIHNYNPFAFSLQDPGVNTWGTQTEITALQNEIKSFYDNFVSHGRAVIIGEWGAADKNNIDDRVHYYETYAAACKQYQIMPINWIYSYDRRTRTWKYPELEDAIFQHFPGANIINSPSLNFENIHNGDYFVLNSDLSISVTANDEDGTISYVDLFIDDILINRKNEVPYNWNEEGQDILLNNMAAGTYTLKATATDNDSKTTTKFITFNVITPITIPSLVEAEDFHKQFGIESETTMDIDGGENIGYIQNNDWTSYIVEIANEGIYNLSARVATLGNGGNIELYIDDIITSIIPVSNTLSSDWQDWYTTDIIEIELPQGIHELKWVFTGDDSFLYNVNWIDFDLKTITNLNNDITQQQDEKLFPNPTNAILHLPTSTSSWHLFDITRKELLSTTKKTIDISNLPKGVYILSSEGRTTRIEKL